MMEFIAGITSAIAIATLASVLKFDKERGFYPTILIVIALYYVLFAVMSKSGEAIFFESLFALIFIAFAITGTRISFQIVSLGLILHGYFDVVHDRYIFNVMVPIWWKYFCATVDVVLGFWVLYLSKKGFFNSVNADNKISTG